jgi:hypothetical protein
MIFKFIKSLFSINITKFNNNIAFINTMYVLPKIAIFITIRGRKIKVLQIKELLDFYLRRLLIQNLVLNNND